MASRVFQPAAKTLIPEAVQLSGYWTIAGAAGVVGVVYVKGVTSVVRAAATAGRYTITLTDTYKYLVSARVSVLAATATGLYAELRSETVGTTKLIVVDFQTFAGVATDPPDLARVMVDLVFSNSNRGIA